MKLSLLALAAGAAAVPTTDVAERAINDYEILNYALTLEHLEHNFYAHALKKFDKAAFAKAGYSPEVRFNIKEVAADEAEHVKFLTAGIKAAGGKPVMACTYDFGLTDVNSFIATASLLEGVGVSAYLGAAKYIMDKTYLTYAGSILTVEARHSSFIRGSMIHPQSPFPYPFDTPLDFDEVYSLASLFIKSCPKTNAKLPVKAFPSLAPAAHTPKPIRAGMWVTFHPAKPVSGKVYGAWITVLGPKTKMAKVSNGGKTVKVYVPHGIAGQSYMVLTSSMGKVTDDNILAGPAVVAVQAPYTYGGFPGK